MDGLVIGGINEKIISAQKAGATLFLAPIGNRDEIVSLPKGIKVAIVATLDDAVKALTAKG